jgi:hypothetical protein
MAAEGSFGSRRFIRIKNNARFAAALVNRSNVRRFLNPTNHTNYLQTLMATTASHNSYRSKWPALAWEKKGGAGEE